MARLCRTGPLTSAISFARCISPHAGCLVNSPKMPYTGNNVNNFYPSSIYDMQECICSNFRFHVRTSRAGWVAQCAALLCVIYNVGIPFMDDICRFEHKHPLRIMNSWYTLWKRFDHRNGEHTNNDETKTTIPNTKSRNEQKNNERRQKNITHNTYKMYGEEKKREHDFAR